MHKRRGGIVDKLWITFDRSVSQGGRHRTQRRPGVGLRRFGDRRHSGPRHFCFRCRTPCCTTTNSALPPCLPPNACRVIPRPIREGRRSCRLARELSSDTGKRCRVRSLFRVLSRSPKRSACALGRSRGNGCVSCREAENRRDKPRPGLRLVPVVFPPSFFLNSHRGVAVEALPKPPGALALVSLNLFRSVLFRFSPFVP